VEDILASVDAEAGRQFLSPAGRVIKDRRFFILTKLAEVNSSVHFINENDSEVKLNDKLLVITPATAVKPDKNSAFVDKSKLEFPLIARKWKQGDYFYPFGMKMKKKKLKKFLTDEKVPLHQKESIYVIESNKKIVWVTGCRMDERFKVTEETKEILKFHLK